MKPHWLSPRLSFRLPGRRCLARIGYLICCLILLTACWPPALPRVVKIGLIAPFEGGERAIGYDAIYAARLAVRELNAAGGAAGWRLELVAYDDRGDPALAAVAARNLAADPDVVAVIGHFRPESTIAGASVLRQATPPLPLVAVDAWVTEPVALMPVPERLGMALVLAAGRGRATRIAIWGTGRVVDGVESAISQYRYQGSRVVTPAQAEPLPNVIVSLLPAAETAGSLRLWRQAGWQGMLLGGSALTEAAFELLAGEVATHTLVVTPYPFPTDLPAAAEWIAAYQGVGPHVPAPGPYALPAYEAVQVVAQAIATDVDAHGRPSRAGVAAALPQVRRNGLLGRLTFNSAGWWHAAPLYRYAWQPDGFHLMPESTH